MGERAKDQVCGMGIEEHKAVKLEKDGIVGAGFKPAPTISYRYARGEESEAYSFLSMCGYRSLCALIQLFLSVNANGDCSQRHISPCMSNGSLC